MGQFSQYLYFSNGGSFRNVTSCKSTISASTNYNQLPLEENSDDDWNDNVNDVASQKALTNTEDIPQVVIRDTDALLNKHKRPVKGTAYEFSRSRNRKSDSDVFCTATRAALCFAAAILLFGSGYLIGFIIPSAANMDSGGANDIYTGANLKKRSENWRTKMLDWGRYAYLG